MTVKDGIKGFFKSLTWRFWVIFGYVLIVGIFCAVWSWSLFGPLNSAILKEQTDSLTAIADAGVVTLSQSTEDPEDLAEELVSGTDLRATIIQSDGTVLGDSEKAADELENHLSRPEVIAALAGTKGTDTRTSATDGELRLYVAIPAVYEGNAVAFRISEKLSSIRGITDGVRNSALALLILGVILAAFVAWRSYTSVNHPVGRLERVRTDFVANASHELKTPVAGIRLLSDAITTASEEGDLDSTRMFAKRLDNEAARLQHLVTDLLDLSRLESKDAQGNLVRTDLHSAITTSFEAHREQARRKGLELVLDDQTQPGDDCYAYIDASDASLIADNLIDNAIRYTEKGNVTVHFASDGTSLILKVSDTGIGIAAADQARIFERFYRVDTARSRETGGTGLGLSLVRHAVKRGGGTVEVESTPGTGTTFQVLIPKAKTGTAV